MIELILYGVVGIMLLITGIYYINEYDDLSEWKFMKFNILGWCLAFTGIIVFLTGWVRLFLKAAE